MLGNPILGAQDLAGQHGSTNFNKLFHITQLRLLVPKELVPAEATRTSRATNSSYVSCVLQKGIRMGCRKLSSVLRSASGRAVAPLSR